LDNLPGIRNINYNFVLANDFTSLIITAINESFIKLFIEKSLELFIAVRFQYFTVTALFFGWRLQESLQDTLD
jgi:hypothetical protein